MAHEKSHQERRTVDAQSWRAALWGLAGILLLLPAIAMQFTSEVAWGGEDFLAAALIIGGAGLAIELAVRLLCTPAQRYLAGGAAVLLALAIWAELAVGILP